MIYEKKLLNTELKYDTDEEKLYRFNKQYKTPIWILIEQKKRYCLAKNKWVFHPVEIDKKSFIVYRLIYYLCNDNFDIFDSKVTIDHINVDHLDNRLENLRVATQAQQARNKLYHNGELIKGFTYLNRGIKRYRGYYNKNGKQITKCFLTQEEAVKFYNDNTEKF